MVVRVALVVLVSACGRLGFGDASDATTLHASISAAPGLDVVDLDARLTFASLDPQALHAIPATGLPTETTFALPDSSGTLTIVVDAHDTRGRSLSATATTKIVAFADNTVAIVIGADLPPTCLDNVAGSNESDVDCGGSCPACGVDNTCLVPADCATGNCVMGRCEPASGPPSWLPIADMPRPRMGLAAITAMDGRIYVFGGSLNDGVMQYPEVDVYDPTRELWGSAPSLLTPRERIAGAMDGDGVLYAIGGTSNSTVVEKWKPGQLQWTAAPSLPAGRGFIGAAADNAGVVHAIGGSLAGVDSAEHDVLLAGGWSASTSVPMPAGDMATVRANDGTLVIAGGPATATTRAFDVATGVWTTLATMNHARSDLGGALGRDERIYTIGGFAGVNGLDFVEAMRPGGPWVDVAPLSTGRDSCGAAVSPDGRIFVFGGRAFSVPGNAQASAEAYGPRVQLGAASGAVDAALVVTGVNFAANANVVVFFDAIPVELGHSDASGAATLTVTVPALAPGAHVVRAVDDRSLYPITLPFTIQ